MVIGILNFGEGLLWLNYLIFCAVAAWGLLQIAAAHARLIGLMLVPSEAGKWLGAAVTAGAYAWFFTIQPDLFIPGLAGGEFFVLFFLGFGIALAIALASGIFVSRLGLDAGSSPPIARERIALTAGPPAELWLPQGHAPTLAQEFNPAWPLIIALREAQVDSLDHLSRELVARGAIVLMVRHNAAAAAMDYVEQNIGRFQSMRRYVMGVGRGADRALELAAADVKIRGALALAPFGRQENARAGLRWLWETDYLTALSVNLQRGPELQVNGVHANSLVVYGDEDFLMPPAAGRELYPSAMVVAGARHFTLAAMPATRRLAAELFGVPAAATEMAKSVRPVPHPAQGELGE
jgi:hypothetical protein